MSGYVVQQILNGIQLGTIYALVALGYSMVYGIIRLINFAHADLFMVGAYIAFFVAAFCAGSTAGLPAQVVVWIALAAGYLIWSIAAERTRLVSALCDRLPLTASSTRWGRTVVAVAVGLVNCVGVCAAAAASFPCIYFPTRLLFSLSLGPALLPVLVCYVMAVCGLLGVVMERLAYRPLRYRPRVSALITALGVSLFLENFCSLDAVFGSAYRPFPAILSRTDLVVFHGLDVTITNLLVMNVLVCAILLAGLWLLVEKTLIGKQMRAVAFDKKAALLMGIDVDRVIAVTFCIGPALAGVSGILFAMNYGILQSPFLGFFPGLKAFIAAVLGGIGSLPGAVIGALIMGITEVFANSVDSNLGFAAAFVVLIVILLLRPAGIMGRERQEKV